MASAHPLREGMLYIFLPRGAYLEWLDAFAQPRLLNLDCTARGVHEDVSWSQCHHLARR